MVLQGFLKGFYTSQLTPWHAGEIVANALKGILKYL